MVLSPSMLIDVVQDEPPEGIKAILAMANLLFATEHVAIDQSVSDAKGAAGSAGGASGAARNMGRLPEAAPAARAAGASSTDGEQGPR